MTTSRKSLEPWLRDDVEFYPHQVEGVRTLARKRSFLLGDDMGLGKSLQALTVFCIDVKMGVSQTLLVVCPVTLRQNWADEIQKFTRLTATQLGEEPDPNRRGHYRKLSPKKREQQLENWLASEGPRVLIANYEQLASEHHADTLKRAHFDVVVFDEAHYIKTHNSKRTTASLKIRSNRSFMLTGTPMLNNADELWPLLHRIDPIRFPKYWSFVSRFCVVGGYNNRQIIGTKNQTELVGVLSEVMVRRLKKDVLDVPEPYYIQVKVGLSDRQQKLYDEITQEFTFAGQELGSNVNEARAMLVFLRLKQLCTTPFALDGKLPDDSEKLDQMEEIVEDVINKGEKVVIFTQFRGALECIARRLNKKFPKIPLFQLHGDIPSRERVPTITEWSNCAGSSIAACMTQVAGVGLNMTAARTAIFVDKLFVPGLNRQAVDRLVRIGASKTQAVQVYELIARGTCEDRIEKILRDKSKLFGEIVEGGVAMRRLMEELIRAEAEDGMH
jgi:SNF2 family DNA or RNA helicase